MVYSASAIIAVDEKHDSYHYATRQALWAVLGIAVLAVAMRIDYRLWRNDALIWGLIAGVSVLLVAVFFKRPVNGAQRWLQFWGLGIQPSEFAKLVCILFTALILERRMHRINDVRYSLLPIAFVVGGFAVLIYREPDMGTAVTLLLIAAVMTFGAGLSYRRMAAAAAIGLPILALVIVSEQYRLERLISFLDPWAYAADEGYQAVRAQLAVGSGGVFGRGLTLGVQKLFYLPEPHTDFIYAVIGEELGLVGATAVLLCYCVMAWRGLRIALRAEEPFGAFVALGLTTMICAQALINISVVLSLLPTKGIPLPLLSSGGSSLIVSLIGVGVLLNVSQHEAVGA